MSKLMRATLVGMCVALALLPASPAYAHETRKRGDYQFIVGFSDEPAYAGSKNGVDLTLTDAQSGDPIVKGVELEVELGFGDETMTLPIEPEFVVGVFGDPGTYGAPFFPTRPGPYTFHFTGTIAGEEIDESFTSGPDTFGEAEDPQAVSFPVQDPSTGQLNERLDQQIPRLTSAVQDATDSVDSSKTLTVVALIVAALALIVGLVSLARGRKAA